MKPIRPYLREGARKKFSDNSRPSSVLWLRKVSKMSWQIRICRTQQETRNYSQLRYKHETYKRISYLFGETQGRCATASWSFYRNVGTATVIFIFPFSHFFTRNCTWSWTSSWYSDHWSIATKSDRIRPKSICKLNWYCWGKIKFRIPVKYRKLRNLATIQCKNRIAYRISIKFEEIRFLRTV